METISQPLTNTEIKEMLQPIPLQPVKKSFPSDQLLSALYFAWDAAERGQMDIFLIKDTAKQVKGDQDLQGDCVTLGVRKNEWQSGQGSIFRTFAEHEIGKPAKEDENEVIYDCKGVPVIIKLYDENECLRSFEVIFYRYETFNLPSPYSLFVEKYE